MPYNVTIKHAPEQRIASLGLRTRLATIGEDIAGGFAVVVGALTEAGAQPIGAPFIIFHDVIDEQTDGDVEICIPVPVGRRFTLRGRVQDDPGGRGRRDHAPWAVRRDLTRLPR